MSGIKRFVTGMVVGAAIVAFAHAMPVQSSRPAQREANIAPMVSAPYRDGVFQAKLAAESGNAARPAVGRWSTAADRELFAAGYNQTDLEQRSINARSTLVLKK